MIRHEVMGYVPDGTAVQRYTLENRQGAYAEISTLGGCLMRICVPDRQGVLDDVLLGYDTVEAMLSASGYMGMLVGRYANRIGGAAFELNGKTYNLAKNDKGNHLHGGIRGFDKYVWQAREEGEALILSIGSPDGDEGYPGALDVQVTYAFTDDNVLCIAYHAMCDADTIINLTNHAYFNLSGPQSPSIEEHFIQIHADAITAVADRACIPTGELMPVENTPFDLRSPRQIGEGLKGQASNIQMQYGSGYDHNFCIQGEGGMLRQACLVEDPCSGRLMETWTDQPGVQFYTGNMIAGNTPGKLGVPYQPRQGFCLETQHYPDSIHHAGFPSCVLRAGDEYATITEYRFSTK